MSATRILIVEDENIVQMDIRLRLIALGYQVVGGAATGEDAVRLAVALRPDLVLMDIKLRGEMDGIQAAQEIRARSHIPIIFLTAFADEDTLRRAQVTEAFGYVLKPFEERELSINIEMALYKNRVEQKLRDSEIRLRTIFDASLEGIFVVDRQGCFVEVNPAGCRMFGYSLEELLAADRSVLCFPEDPWPELEALRRGTNRTERRLRCKDGSELWVEMTSSPLTLSGQEYTLQTMWDVTERKLIEARLLHDALHDHLTNLPNRALFLDRLGQMIQRAFRSDCGYGVLFLDLDHFKVINDSLGHNVGNDLLVAIAGLLTRSVRNIDTVARLGGDEFVILLEGVSGVEECLEVAARIQDSLQQPFTLGKYSVYTSTSIGIVYSRKGYDSTTEVLRDADIAMYRAKAMGKSRSVVFEPQMRKRAMARMELETDLRRALEQNQFLLNYQPILSLTEGKVVGFEALLRWAHPTQGLISPVDFIPVAEETGLILAIGQWVMEHACWQMQDWITRLPNMANCYVSVNVSGIQLTHHEFLDDLCRILKMTGLDANRLRLEITESVLVESDEALMGMLDQLRQLGIQLYIDDFGTGYSSLSYIHRFPVSTIKIDRSFVERIDSIANHNDLIQSIMRFANDLGLEAIAEGVETKAQMEVLKSLLCNYGQGFFISRPLSPRALEEMLSSTTLSLPPL